MDRTVHARRHAARTAGFSGDPRRIEPQITPLLEHTRKIQLVVGQNGDPRVLVRQINQFIENVDRIRIKRIRFACPDHLHRIIVLGDEAKEAFHIVFQKPRALVLGKTARPDNGKDLGIEHLSRLIGDFGKKKLFEVFFTRDDLIIFMFVQRPDQRFIGPKTAVLCIGYRDDRADSLIGFPHLIGYLCMKCRDGVGDFSAAQRPEGETERAMVMLPHDLSDFLHA